jgi:hypothetical protein
VTRKFRKMMLALAIAGASVFGVGSCAFNATDDTVDFNWSFIGNGNMIASADDVSFNWDVPGCVTVTIQ